MADDGAEKKEAENKRHTYALVRVCENMYAYNAYGRPRTIHYKYRKPTSCVE